MCKLSKLESVAIILCYIICHYQEEFVVAFSNSGRKLLDNPKPPVEEVKMVQLFQTCFICHVFKVPGNLHDLLMIFIQM